MLFAVIMSCVKSVLYHLREIPMCDTGIAATRAMHAASRPSVHSPYSLQAAGRVNLMEPIKPTGAFFVYLTRFTHLA